VRQDDLGPSCGSTGGTDRGSCAFQGEDLTALSTREMNRLRPRMQIIYQDPYGSLNPRLPVSETIGEAVRYHGIARGNDVKRLVKDVLRRVGLSPACAERYPHEFSGGQRQRIGIARALAMSPALIICDEPVSALDVSIQSQILNLLKDLQQQYGMALLFIAHGLHVVKHVSNRVAVMYLGRIAEIAPSQSLYSSPRHPYTKALVSAIPLPDPGHKRRTRRILLEGDVPSPIDPPAGCRFHTRCWLAEPRCAEQVPPPVEVAPGHVVWCHLANED